MFCGADATPIPDWFNSIGKIQGAMIKDMTKCDMSLPGHMVAVAAFGEGHPNQPCTADMWRFDIAGNRWEHQTQPDNSDMATGGGGGGERWPAARCGANVVSVPGVPDSQTFIGGWAGASSGECEAWNAAENCTNASLAACSFKSFLSVELPGFQARSTRGELSQCEPLSEAWELRAVIE
jgi:hypothetical protein